MAQTINVNTNPESFPATLYFSQGDIGREFDIILASSDGYAVPAGATVTMVATKPSGFGFSVAGTLTNNVASFVTTETMTNEAGRFPAEIRIEYNGDVIGTANFYLDGEPDPHPADTIDGDAETIIPELTVLVERVETAASSVLDMQVVATTLPAGSDATYSYDEETNTATFGIPKGADGTLSSGVLAPTYSTSATYAVGDYVYYSGSLYRCTTAITTAESWTSGHWTQVALAPEVTDLKAELFKGKTITTSPGYYSDGGAIASAGAYTKEVYTNIFDVNPGDRIHFALTMPDTRELWAAVGQYDNDGNWISRNAYGAVVQSKIIWDYTVPSGVYKVSFTYRTYGAATVSIAVAVLSTIYSKNDVDNIAGDIEKSLNVIDADVDGLIPLPMFENGVVYANNGTLAYANRTWGIRPVKGTGIQLNSGDIIRSKNHSLYEMLGAYTTDGTTFTGISSQTSPYIVPANGMYYITFQLRAGSGTISDVSEFLKNFQFFRPSSRKAYGSMRSAFDIFSIKSVNHRGYNTTCPENTIPAFIKSAEEGFQIVETDLRFTSDNVPVLLHDTSINRTARNSDGTVIGSTINIADITYAQALTYDFGIWKGTQFTGTKIPTLEEAVTIWKKLGIFAYVELEYEMTGDQIKTAIDTIKALDYIDHITFISYQMPYLADVVSNEQSCRVGYIVETIDNTKISDLQKVKSKYNEVFIDANISNITSETLAIAKQAGESVESWTIDTEAELDGLDMYISGVTSDNLIAQDYYKNHI